MKNILLYKSKRILLYKVEKVKGNKIVYENQEYVIGRIYQKNFKNLYERYLMTCL